MVFSTTGKDALETLHQEAPWLKLLTRIKMGKWEQGPAKQQRHYLALKFIDDSLKRPHHLFTIRATWVSKESFPTHPVQSVYHGLPFGNWAYQFARSVAEEPTAMTAFTAKQSSKISKLLKWHRYWVCFCLFRPFLRPTASLLLISEEWLGSCFVPLDVYSG